MDMLSETAERLREYCLERIGDDLRAVIGYTDKGIKTTYFRADVTTTVDDFSMNALNNPILAFHQNGWRLTEMFEYFGPPGASMQAYEDILLFTFPITRTEGIFVSVDRRDSYTSDLFANLETLVDESEVGKR